MFIPKSVTVIAQEGYSWAKLRADALAGLTVAIVAAPLAMAIAIASGVTPAQGLITAVIGGFLISALGGSRFQIGGPTGAFIVVVYGVVHTHGYDGLALATMMAGAILVLAGLLRVGTWIKYIPEPVVTGFTAGIAVIIFTSQIRDLLGLSMTDVPADFLEKVAAFWAARDTIAAPAIAVALGALAVILLINRYLPRWPGMLIAVVGATLLVWVLKLPVETIGTRFGAAATALPTLALPQFSIERMQALLPSALTIAFLAGVESLLSAMVADGMTGRRHRSNCEIVAQGVANIATPLFGGISATGAIARTATNIRAGAQTPFAGMFHALYLLVFVLGAGPLLAYVPLAALAAVLTVVAWNMSEQERFRNLLRGLSGDRAVLLATFLLTVLVDLTMAIEVGVVLAAIIFMHRMAEASAVERGVSLIERDQDDFSRPGRESYQARAELPAGVEMFDLHGPLFFGAASRLMDALDAAFPPPRAFVLRFRDTPLADASGVGALERFLKRCETHSVTVVFCELRPEVRAVLEKLGVLKRVDVAESYEDAIALAAAAAEKR